MQKLITRPANDYDPLWALFNEQNPGMLRAVGADTSGDDGDGDDGDGDDDGSGDGDDGDGGDDADAKAAEEKAAADKAAADAAGDGEWRVGIDDPEALKLANRYTSPTDQAKAHYELQKSFSGRVMVPGKDASDEDRAAFSKAIGVPEEATGYKYDKPSDMEADDFNSEENQGVIAAFKDRMHSVGATSAQVSAGMDLYFEMKALDDKTIADNDQKAIDDAEAALKKDWGKDYDQNVKFGDAFLEKQQAIDLKQMELKDGSLLGSHPDFIRMTAVAGRRTGEGQLQIGLGGTEAGVALEKKAEELAAEEHAAYARGDSAESNRINKERKAILEQIHGADEAA